MEVDLRSESPQELARLDRLLHAAVDSRGRGGEGALAALHGAARRDVHRPRRAPRRGAERLPAPIVRAALAAGRALGFTAEPDASSTDANIAMSLGIPAITLDGGGRGFGAHALSERYEDGDRGWLGPQWAALVALSLAGVR